MYSQPDRPQGYQIVIKGYLDDDWSEWFDGLTITRAKDGETVLTGLLADQSALHGVLIKIRDLGLSIVSLNPIEADG